MKLHFENVARLRGAFYRPVQQADPLCVNETMSGNFHSTQRHKRNGEAMKLATFEDSKGTRIGVVVGDEIIDLAVAQPGLPTDMIAFLEAGDDAMALARKAESHSARVPLSSVKLRPPVLRPPEFLITGANYADHATESINLKGIEGLGLEDILNNSAAQQVPMIVNKQASCINGPYDDVIKPRVSDKLDYEAELAVVIGKRGRNVSRADAPGIIAGFMCANDVSARDWQWKSPTHTLGKSFETHGPVGPWIVTLDEVGDPHDLEITCHVNGELRQKANTSQMTFTAYGLIEVLSSIFPLLPGMIILTGTCAGVGVALDPPSFLQDGDVVEVEIEKLGKIRNKIVAE